MYECVYMYVHLYTENQINYMVDTLFLTDS